MDKIKALVLVVIASIITFGFVMGSVFHGDLSKAQNFSLWKLEEKIDQLEAKNSQIEEQNNILSQANAEIAKITAERDALITERKKAAEVEVAKVVEQVAPKSNQPDDPARLVSGSITINNTNNITPAGWLVDQGQLKPAKCDELAQANAALVAENSALKKANADLTAKKDEVSNDSLMVKRSELEKAAKIATDLAQMAQEYKAERDALLKEKSSSEIDNSAISDCEASLKKETGYSWNLKQKLEKVTTERDDFKKQVTALETELDGIKNQISSKKKLQSEAEIVELKKKAQAYDQDRAEEQARERTKVLRNEKAAEELVKIKAAEAERAEAEVEKFRQEKCLEEAKKLIETEKKNKGGLFKDFF